MFSDMLVICWAYPPYSWVVGKGSRFGVFRLVGKFWAPAPAKSGLGRKAAHVAPIVVKIRALGTALVANFCFLCVIPRPQNYPPSPHQKNLGDTTNNPKTKKHANFGGRQTTKHVNFRDATGNKKQEFGQESGSQGSDVDEHGRTSLYSALRRILFFWSRSPNTNIF